MFPYIISCLRFCRISFTATYIVLHQNKLWCTSITGQIFYCGRILYSIGKTVTTISCKWYETNIVRKVQGESLEVCPNRNRTEVLWLSSIKSVCQTKDRTIFGAWHVTTVTKYLVKHLGRYLTRLPKCRDKWSFGRNLKILPSGYDEKIL